MAGSPQGCPKFHSSLPVPSPELKGEGGNGERRDEGGKKEEKEEGKELSIK